MTIENLHNLLTAINYQCCTILQIFVEKFQYPCYMVSIRCWMVSYIFCVTWFQEIVINREITYFYLFHKIQQIWFNSIVLPCKRFDSVSTSLKANKTQFFNKICRSFTLKQSFVFLLHCFFIWFVHGYFVWNMQKNKKIVTAWQEMKNNSY